MGSEPRRKRKPRYERGIFTLALLTGLPAVALALVLLWRGDFAPRTQWTLTILMVGVWLAFVTAMRERVVRPLQTISNMLAALREGDFSLRARGSDPDDALGLLLLELNSLGEDLRAQRLGALEATALLRRVMEEIDVAVFAFDESRVLRLVNRGGAALLGRPAEQLLGKDAAELGLAESLTGDAPRVIELTFPGRHGRWELLRGTFRQGGLPHQLLVLADVSRALSEEERQAWQRLIRVLSHELNNSLAPIKSIAQSLAELVRRDVPPPDWREDLRKGLGVIGSRAESLSRLMAAYARLARLPRPRLEPVPVGEWVRRVAALETRRPVTVCPGPDVTIQADGGQLDQLLINLVRNAVDATLEIKGGGLVELGWTARNGRLEVWVRDDGPGLADTVNLFVPFYTTKTDGSGIGLALSRQIADAHNGTLTLANHGNHRGCEARLSLPILASEFAPSSH
jgi:two-component system nitrogen regulation sensor histidine kinase NtrY